MKITEVRTFVTSPKKGNWVLVKILTDDGVYGVGEGSLFSRELAVVSTLKDHLTPLLIGKDPSRIEDIYQEIFRGTYWRGGPVMQAALSAIDMALWDIKGKVAKMPVYDLLGGKVRESVRLYIHCYGNSDKEILENGRALMSKGVTCLRVKNLMPELNKLKRPDYDWMGPEALKAAEFWDPALYTRTMPRTFELLRKELGEEVDLCHDIHGRVNPIQACKILKDLEEFRMFFAEDPLKPEHKNTFRLLRQHSATPIAMGERFHSPQDYLTLITENLIDYVRLDMAIFGGISPTRKVAAVAELYEIDMAFHGPGSFSPILHAVNAHMDLALPNFGIQEGVLEFSKEVKDIVSGGPQYDGKGSWVLSDAPGLGCDINEEAVKKYPYKSVCHPYNRLKDGSVYDW